MYIFRELEKMVGVVEEQQEETSVHISPSPDARWILLDTSLV